MIRKQEIIKLKIEKLAPTPKFGVGVKKLKIERNSKPVANSTNGYCQEIFFLQYRHFPLKIKKEKIGIRSGQDKICLQ